MHLDSNQCWKLRSPHLNQIILWFQISDNEHHLLIFTKELLEVYFVPSACITQFAQELWRLSVRTLPLRCTWCGVSLVSWSFINQADRHVSRSCPGTWPQGSMEPNSAWLRWCARERRHNSIKPGLFGNVYGPASLGIFFLNGHCSLSCYHLFSTSDSTKVYDVAPVYQHVVVCEPQCSFSSTPIFVKSFAQREVHYRWWN